MGNRSSSAAAAGPPPLLASAVMGDFSSFEREWNNAANVDKSSSTSSPINSIHDSQGNNALHALFSCRTQSPQCRQILDLIHNNSSEELLAQAYQRQNSLGCTPLWILVAYGNVDLLRRVQEIWANVDDDDDKKMSMESLLQVPNYQGDSPFLATCSQGNLEMVQYLRVANQKGTTPLQIVVGNHHVTVLHYILQQSTNKTSTELLRTQLTQSNPAGLSLFHICSERNAHEALRALLTFWMDSYPDGKDDLTHPALDQILSLTDKNGANALHVAVFCGNVEVTELWLDVIEKTCQKQRDDNNNNNNNDSRQMFLNKTDGDGRPAYWIARLQGREAIAQLLVERGGVDTSDPMGGRRAAATNAPTAGRCRFDGPTAVSVSSKW
eukprot:CAMPEP_0168760162 /NCGR_PEP_ID=MMETSP0724-20121128/22614_1 /TAXON_ID=265536 /ORGANISM="Amphiprora sp., Strain CCMP467" /LENGTH=381 /DNA_ID=CAMNT_0008809143 /DNA_START=171 /DNA_END=1316 /DNA_ORIENTATION=-